jgi:hypothetical protein
MAEALLITRDDLVSLTALGGNVDSDKFIQFVKIAQDIHIQNFLGTKLLRKIQLMINNNTLTGTNYETLLIDYIKPMLIHWSMLEYLPFAAYTIANKGVYKHTSENSDNVEKIEVDMLIEKQRDIAQNYTQRFIDHMGFYNNLFPEYNMATNGEVPANRNNYFSGWHI